MAQHIPNDVVWPEHPDIRGRDLLPMNVPDQELPQELADSTECWRLLHPYEQRGTLNPSVDTPRNLRRLAENEELVESLQIMEYLMDHPPLGSRQDYRCYPPRYGDPYYHHVGSRRPDLERAMPLAQEETLEMGYSRPPAGINASNGPQGNMTPLRRIQRTEEEREEVTSIYPTQDEGGSA